MYTICPGYKLCAGPYGDADVADGYATGTTAIAKKYQFNKESVEFKLELLICKMEMIYFVACVVHKMQEELHGDNQSLMRFGQFAAHLEAVAYLIDHTSEEIYHRRDIHYPTNLQRNKNERKN